MLSKVFPLMHIILSHKLLLPINDHHLHVDGLVYGVWCHFQQYFSYIMAVSFIGGGHRSTNPVHGEVYLIQHNVINFVSDLPQVGGFLWVLRYCHDLTEILLKVALNSRVCPPPWIRPWMCWCLNQAHR
jgi:hypothetical protein